MTDTPKEYAVRVKASGLFVKDHNRRVATWPSKTAAATEIKTLWAAPLDAYEIIPYVRRKRKKPKQE